MHDFGPDERPRRRIRRLSRVPWLPRRRTVLVAAGAALAFAVSVTVAAHLWTDLLWFREVGRDARFGKVFTTRLLTQVALFAVFALVMSGAVVASAVLARRLRPPPGPVSGWRASVEPYRRWYERRHRPFLRLLGLLLALVGGLIGAGQWRTWLLWRHPTTFAATDPQFGRDLGFYVFVYPWLRFLLTFAFATVALSLVVAVCVHLLYGGIRIEAARERSVPPARAHLSALLGAFVLLKAAAYALDRYGLAVASGGPFPDWAGLTYTDDAAVLPAKNLLIFVALICSVVLFANIIWRTVLLPAIGVGLLVLSAVLIGGIYPWIVQELQVRPSEAQREEPYIARNIASTREAYGLDGVKIRGYPATTTGSPGQLREDTATAGGVRLLDPAVVSSTFRNLQQIRGFYAFPGVLDVDRYRIDGELETLVVAARELSLDGLPAGQRNWVNDHLRYTHGYGFVAALGDQVRPDGKPNFVAEGIPTRGRLGNFQPRIYYGERSPGYSIVGAPPGAPPREIDHPDDTSPTGQRNNTYQGGGGVPVGPLANRLAYTVRFGELKILLTDAVNTRSRILYFRRPQERVQRVAPWLTLDQDAYPAVVGGRIVWIVDGYTTARTYPYSSRVSMADATADATTPPPQGAGPGDDVNYLRNSVKATVDAYDGTVALYQWDPDDPVLKTWMATFPGTVRPRSAISRELRAHLRYPEDIFKVQRAMLARYHVTDAQAFYSGQDFWRVPDDPTAGTRRRTAREPAATVPPYYLTLRMPQRRTPAFSLTTTFVPVNRPNLAAFAAVDAEPGAGYGAIDVLQLPRDTAIPGPGQAQNNFVSDPAVAQTINILRRGGSTVDFGNLLTLPVGGGLLYVEPVYVKAASGTSYPLLQKVLVSFGDTTAFEDTLADALDAVFQGEAATAPGRGPPSSAELRRALADARQALIESRDALRRGDLEAWAAAQERMQAAVERAIESEPK